MAFSKVIPNRSHGNIEKDISGSELTPKPLRIVKRILIPTTTNSPVILAESQIQQNLVPTRRSSVTNTTELDLSLRDPAESTSPWSRRHAFLNVRKQRMSDEISTTSGELTHSGRPAVRSCSPQMQTAPDKRIGAASPQLNSTTVQKPYFLSPINDELVVPPAATPLIGGHRHAMPTNEGSHKHADMERGLASPGMRRQPSFRHRFISRMMSGLMSKSNSNAMAPLEEKKSLISPFDQGSVDLEPVEQLDIARRSVSSAASDTLSGNDLDNALAAFPSPPMSIVTPSTTVASFETSKTYHPQSDRELSQPERPKALAIELDITPEKEFLGSENETSMFVAVDVRACLTGGGVEYLKGRSPDNGLDIAVIIDNSLFTSPDTLMASCETARFLASILNTETDRMAVVCTSPSYEDPSGPTIISLLNPINSTKMKVALDFIVSSNAKPQPGALERALRCAQDLLLHPPNLKPGNQPPSNTFGHVFIFTSDTKDLSKGCLEHEVLQMHVVYPGSAPQGYDDCFRCNGWKLRSMDGKVPQAISSKRDPDPQNLFNALRVLVCHSRVGHAVGSINDLALDLKAGPNCSIEGVMGKSQFRRLQGGEVRTVLVKLRVKPPEVIDCPMRDASRKTSTRTSYDLAGELEQMLGASITTVLTVRLRYRHSMLSAQTICFAAAHCDIKRQIPKSTPQSPVLSYTATRSSLVHRRLANHVATHYKPSDALLALRTGFGPVEYCSDSPEYLETLDKELKYQSRIAQRLAMFDSPEKAPKLDNVNPSSNSIERFAYIPYPKRDKPRDWIDGVSDQEVTLTGGTYGDVLSHLEGYHETKQIQPDEARKIWGDLRKMSKAKPNAGRGRVVSLKPEDEKMRSIRELALRNKRSIGADSLRSFTAPPGSLRTGMGAPWL